MKTRQSSLRSLRSSRDIRHDFRLYQTRLDFEKELCEACKRYGLDGVHVQKCQQNDEYYKALKLEQKRAFSRVASIAPGMARAVPSGTDHPSRVENDHVAVAGSATGPSATARSLAVPECLYKVDSMYDAQDDLVELVISNFKVIPRILMQCIVLLSPYFRFLTRFSIVKSRVDGYALLELKKMLQWSHLTEMVFDDSVLSEASYAILLEEKSKLRYLSFARCRLDDQACWEIASKIEGTDTSLALLNLSSNFITDAGVKHLAHALRTNRSLRYLNLANNQVTDDGAMNLLDVLKEFPITEEDIAGTQNRYLVHLKQKLALYCRFFDDNDMKLIKEDSNPAVKQKSRTPSSSSRRSRKDINTSITSEPMSARATAFDILGQFLDPFSRDCLKIKDDMTYCIGNIVLCYLNLAYNSISFCTLKKLEDVMCYQSEVKKPSDYGLMKVVVDGNPLPAGCAEYNTLAQMMVNSVSRQVSHVYEGKQRTSIKQRTPRK